MGYKMKIRHYEGDMLRWILGKLGWVGLDVYMIIFLLYMYENIKNKN